MTATATATVLSTIGLGKDYGDRPALRPLDLEVARGSRIALIGHNGSGKTTLLRMVAGLLEPSAGRILVDGSPAGGLDARRAVSWLSDTPTFYDDLSLWEHLEFVARLHGVAEWEQRGAALLDRLHLGHRRDDLPTAFSRGLRQKASIALGLVRPSSLLLVDEPFVGLDAAGKEALLALLDDASAGGATLLVATHELGFVERVDRVLVLRDGELVHDGPPDGLDVEAAVRQA